MHHPSLYKDRAPFWIPRLPIDRDMYRYIPPCLGTGVPDVAGSRSLCILAQGMRRSYVLVLHPCQGMRLGLVGIGKAGRSAKIEPKPRARLVWSGLALMDAWALHPIPNC